MAHFSRYLCGFLFVAGAFFAVLAQSDQAEALDCNRRLILVGDPMARVRSLCGEPASTHSRTESRSVFGGVRRAGGSLGEAYTVTIQVEVWVYDFGPRRFMEELTFADGVLRSTRTLGYGSARADGRFRAPWQPVSSR